MKKICLFFLLAIIVFGCTVAPVGNAVQTSVAKITVTKTESEAGAEESGKQERINQTPTFLPTNTMTPTPSAAVWFFNEVDITSLHIFSAGEDLSNVTSRKYANAFTQDEAQVIYCHLELAHKGPETDQEFTMSAVYYGPEGGKYGEVSIDPVVESGWTMSTWLIGYGWDIPGNWDAGQYRVEVLVGDRIIASDSFEILELTSTPEATLTLTPKPGATVNTESLNIRSGPDTVFGIVGSAAQGDLLEILGQAYGCGWLMIRTANGIEGWVSSELVDYQLPCSDIPAAAIPPTPITLPTFTPTAEKPQGKTVSVKIINNTGGTLTLNLTGPATYSFTFTTGTHTIQVIPGTYTYTAWGCGATASGTRKLAQGDEWSWFCE